MASRYIVMNNPDKAMDWIEKGFELHAPQEKYILGPDPYHPPTSFWQRYAPEEQPATGSFSGGEGGYSHRTTDVVLLFSPFRALDMGKFSFTHC